MKKTVILIGFLIMSLVSLQESAIGEQDVLWEDSFVNGSHFLIEVMPSGDAVIDDSGVERIIEVFSATAEEFGISKEKRIIKAVGDRMVAVQIATGLYLDEAEIVLGRSVVLEFSVVEESPELLNQAIQGNVPPGYRFLPVKGRNESLLVGSALLKGDAVENARVIFDPHMFGAPTITLVFKPEGIKNFAKITQAHLNKRLAIIVDRIILSAPLIIEPILGGKVQISGNFSKEEAHLLALSLRAAAMPAPLKLIEAKKLTKDLWLGNKGQE